MHCIIDFDPIEPEKIHSLENTHPYMCKFFSEHPWQVADDLPIIPIPGDKFVYNAWNEEKQDIIDMPFIVKERCFILNEKPDLNFPPEQQKFVAILYVDLDL